jgi:hypothetical protein
VTALDLGGRQLTHLDLRGNQLREVPAAVADLPRLGKIDLRWNGWRALPSWLGALEQRGCRIYL